MGVIKPVVEEPTIIIDDTSSETASIHSAEDATERSPLVVKPESITSRRRFSPFDNASALRSVSPLAVAAVGGLLVGCVPWLRTRVAGEDSSAWQTVGVALGVLGWAFPVVEIVGIGAGLRAAGKRT